MMIVDDHPAIRVAIRALLSQSEEFSTIYESVDGSEALETLKNTPVDLVIIDIELPNFDGFSLLKKLQQRGFTGKSLFLSAKNEQVFAVQRMTKYVYQLPGAIGQRIRLFELDYDHRMDNQHRIAQTIITRVGYEYPSGKVTPTPEGNYLYTYK